MSNLFTMDMIKQKPQKKCVLKNLRNFINNCTRNAITNNKASCKYSENCVDSGLFYNCNLTPTKPQTHSVWNERDARTHWKDKLIVWAMWPLFLVFHFPFVLIHTGENYEDNTISRANIIIHLHNELVSKSCGK